MGKGETLKTPSSRNNTGEIEILHYADITTFS